MSEEIQLTPVDERGIKLLDELEAKTALLPFKTDAQGGRTYALSRRATDEFDRVLDRIGGDWRNHLTRTRWGGGAPLAPLIEGGRLLRGAGPMATGLPGSRGARRAGMSSR